MDRTCRALAALLAAAVTTSLIGCGFPAPSSDGGTTGDGSASTAAPQVLSERPPQTDTVSHVADTEPNDTFLDGQIVYNGSTVELVGSIPAGADPPDLDIYRLNGGAAGDRIQASFTLYAGRDVVLGLLDDRQRILAYADPSSVVNGPRQIDLVLREPTSELIAVVGARSASSIDRPYKARVTGESGTGVLGYQPQVIVLNFDGADSVAIGRRAAVYVPPFDAATIDARFAGRTAEIIDLVTQFVREDYAGLDVVVYPSGDPSIPPGGVTTVHFGTYDASLLGLADSIDPYNTDTDQNAILYTDTFRLFSALNPTLTDIAHVLANVASHESGHLLGLRHTADVVELMDITATARQMLADQFFRTAPLHASVLPAGFQDAPALLAWALGGSLVSPPQGKAITLQRQAAAINDPNDFVIPHGLLGTCAGETDPSADGG